MKAQSFRYRGGVVRIADWHGRADVASLAVRGRGPLESAAVERLLDRVRAAGYRKYDEEINVACNVAFAIKEMDDDEYFHFAEIFRMSGENVK